MKGKMRLLAFGIVLVAGCATRTENIRFEGFYGERGMRDDTSFRCWCDETLVRFQFVVRDDTVCSAPVVRHERDLEDYDRVEVFFAPTADLTRPYCCIEIDPSGRVLDYRATFPRRMEYGWRAMSLRTQGRKTDGGYAVEGCLDLAELMAEGIDPAGFHFGAFRADYAPGGRLVDWYSACPPDGEPADFHRPVMFIPARLIENNEETIK